MFTSALRDAFIPADVHQRYLHSYLQVKQGSNNIDTYALAYRKALMLAGSVPEPLAVAHFTANLQPSIAAEVSRHVPDTLTEAIRLARWAEHAQKLARP